MFCEVELLYSRIEETFFFEIFILKFLFCCYLFAAIRYFHNMGSNVIVEEEMELTSDSTVEYLGSSNGI